MVLSENLTRSIDDVVATAFDHGLCVRDAFGIPATPRIGLTQ